MTSCAATFPHASCSADASCRPRDRRRHYAFFLLLLLSPCCFCYESYSPSPCTFPSLFPLWPITFGYHLRPWLLSVGAPSFIKTPLLAQKNNNHALFTLRKCCVSLSLDSKKPSFVSTFVFHRSPSTSGRLVLTTPRRIVFHFSPVRHVLHLYDHSPTASHSPCQFTSHLFLLVPRRARVAPHIQPFLTYTPRYPSPWTAPQHLQQQ